MANIKTAWATDPPYLKAAFSKLGLSEIVGPKHEKQVLAMYAASGHPEIKDDETAWCAAFVGWALLKGGLPNTNNLMARSYSKYGTACDLDEIIPRGAIVVWPRGKPPSGHVNFCLHDDGTYLTCIGGNQGNGKGGGVTISREAKNKAVAARLPVAKEIIKEADDPKSSTGTIAARTAGGVVTTATLASQVVSAVNGPVAQHVEEVEKVIDTGGRVVEVSKQIVQVAPSGFWENTLSFVQSPIFLASVIAFIGGAWLLTYILRKRKEQE